MFRLARRSSSTAASSNSSNTPLPLALTIRSASRASSRHRSDSLVSRGRIDDDLRPRRVGDVAVLLPVKGVRLVKGDAMPAPVQRADDAAVVGRGAVPVGGDEAGPEERDVQAVCIGMGLRLATKFA